jgi:hypothetical protein
VDEEAEVVVKDEVALVALVPDSLTFNVTIVEVEVEVAVDVVFGGVYFKSSTEYEPICVVTAIVSGQSVGKQPYSIDAPLSNLPSCTFGFELGLRPTAG